MSADDADRPGPVLRIGTWNLQGRWDHRHQALIDAMDCDVLLLTEVSERVLLTDHVLHLGDLPMMPRRRWAAVAARVPMTPLADPHGASAMVELGSGTRACSSVLPWRGATPRPPWVGTNTAERTVEAVDAVERVAPTVWGGDWNHSLSGREYAGSMAGRRHLLSALDRMDLQQPTALLPHRLDGCLSIDHVAVPSAWLVRSTTRFSAVVDRVQISDHDAYAVEVVVR